MGVVISSVLSGIVWLTGATLVGVLFHQHFGGGHYFGVEMVETEAARAVIILGAFLTSSITAGLSTIKSRRGTIGYTWAYAVLVGTLVSLPAYILLLFLKGRYYANWYLGIVLLNDWPRPASLLWEDTVEISIALLAVSVAAAVWFALFGEKDPGLEESPAKPGVLAGLVRISLKVAVSCLCVLAVYAIVEVPQERARARGRAERELAFQAGTAIEELEKALKEASTEDHMGEFEEKVRRFQTEGLEVLYLMITDYGGDRVRWSVKPDDIGKSTRDRSIVFRGTAPRETEEDRERRHERYRFEGARPIRMTERCRDCHSPDRVVGEHEFLGLLHYLVIATAAKK